MNVAKRLCWSMHPVLGIEHERPCPDCLKALQDFEDAGYAVVKLPEGVAVAHGARLVHWNVRRTLYKVEDTP